VLFTLHRPHEIDEGDIASFPVREAALACAVPWHLLSAAPVTSSVVSPLCVLRSEALSALRGEDFSALAHADRWFQGHLFLPPHQIMRAYQLQPAADSEKDGCLELEEQPVVDTHLGNISSGTELRHSTSPPFSHNPFFSLQGVVEIASCSEFIEQMKRIRSVCAANHWAVVYHYTNPTLAKVILRTGLRMSTQGQGGMECCVLPLQPTHSYLVLVTCATFASDGGVYFSTLGPAAFELGTMRYEENIIVDCFGVERLHEYKGKQLLDLCLVYGAEPTVLTQAPGGRDNAKMVSKSLFQVMSLPTKDGNFFLRKDRILGAFLLRAVAGDEGCKSDLVEEGNKDFATKEWLDRIQRSMKADGDKLRSRHLELHPWQPSEFLDKHDDFALPDDEGSVTLDGDLEMTG
jgi:hypothetical protein